MSEKTSKWLALALFASLLVNVFAAGVILNAPEKGKLRSDKSEQHRPERSRSSMDIESSLLRTMARKEGFVRDSLKELRSSFPKRHEMYRKSIQDRIALYELMLADDIDEEALLAALEAGDTRRDETRKPGRTILINGLKAMPKEEREALINERIVREKNRLARFEERAKRREKRSN